MAPRSDLLAEDGSSDHHREHRTRLLIRTIHSGGPVFFVRKAGADAIVQLLRKPRGAPESAFVVVGRRTGPGPIGDERTVTDGPYDYAVQQKTPAGGLSPMSPVLSGRIGPQWDELLPLSAFLSKPEMEWVATLRGVLGVPASHAPTNGTAHAGSDQPASRD